MAVELYAEVHFNVSMPSDAQIKAELTTAMRSAVAAVLKRAQANLSGRFVKTRSGRGLRSVRTKVTSAGRDVLGTIGTPVFYLRLMETGFPAQVLTTKKKGFTFLRGGELIRVKSIHHPGVAARPWLKTALTESTNDIVLAFDQAAQSIGRFVAGDGRAA